MEQFLGRKLGYNEIVHHKNGNIRDNRIENLILLPRGVHTVRHRISVNRSAESRKKTSEKIKSARAKKFWTGKPKNPEETRKKQSEARKQYWQLHGSMSEETRAKISKTKKSQHK